MIYVVLPMLYDNLFGRFLIHCYVVMCRAYKFIIQETHEVLLWLLVHLLH